MPNQLSLPTDRPRIQSIDILRGIVMIVMALDHVRDFFHAPALLQDPLDLSTTHTALFFTRWVTHFCAPIFVFLSGVSAFLSGQKKSTAELSRFLISRGIWLIIVELVLITLAITFDPRYRFLILQVIWAIGWSMILLGLLIRLSVRIILPLGLLLVFAHNLFDFFPAVRENKLMELLVTGSGTIWPISEGHAIFMIYAILPWTGIMLIGYSFGRLFSSTIPQDLRRKWLLRLALLSLSLFVILRLINAYGDPAPWSSQSTTWFSFLSFLNVTKYPVSLQYTCLTVGTAILFLYLFEFLKGAWTRFFVIYGKVPFFYYILHFYLIHLLCVVLFYVDGYGTADIVTPGVPFLFRPINFGYSLGTVYLIWIFVILVLYYPCRWFAGLKSRRKDWWLSYL